MNNDFHERARMLIALSGQEGISKADQSWLEVHLESCGPCRQFAERSGETIRSLRGISITAGSDLVSTTQMRVRQRAQELQRQRERLWVIAVCCAAVTLAAALSMVILWSGLAWVGQQARLSTPVQATGFAVFCLMPAIFASVLLLARGIYLADQPGSYRG